MASLNISLNGPSIKSSYQAVINGPLPSSNSATYTQWALFSVQAPLMNAFQDSGAKESILKVQSTGDGELLDLVEEFSEGRVQFAFIKLKDPNSGLPKYVLIAWCGDGVPERTKGYFTSHLAAVSKILHGYHVQISARSESDLVPENIIQKVADSSGAKYSAGTTSQREAPSRPSVKSKPAFTPTSVTTTGHVNPIVAARSQNRSDVDGDGWGSDAPQVSRSQLEKVDSAYKPTIVEIPRSVAKQERNASDAAIDSAHESQRSDVIKGGYQPIGRVDIAAIRAQAQHSKDERPTPVKGAYEPVGKVDIAALRAKARAPDADTSISSGTDKTISVQQQQPERLASIPKPKVAKKFVSDLTNTKLPTPISMGYPVSAAPSPVPVGVASRTFADQGGKTPAQLWAEKKAKEKGTAPGAPPSEMASSPINVKKSGGEWKSGYTGKSWAPVQAPAYERIMPGQTTDSPRSEDENQALQPPTDGVLALSDQLNAAELSGVTASSSGSSTQAAMAAPSSYPDRLDSLDTTARPPSPRAADENEAPGTPPDNATMDGGLEGNHALAEALPSSPPLSVPTHSTQSRMYDEVEVIADEKDSQSHQASETLHGNAHEINIAGPVAPLSGGKHARVQYDYEKAEDNEVELQAGDFVTDIDMVDADWWLGTNSRGERGLFPSNYVELEDEGPATTPDQAKEPQLVPAQIIQPTALPPSSTPAPTQSERTATALFDYEAAEDNELGFPDGAKITQLEFPDEDWWFGHYNGAAGLFPSNYVELDP